MDSNFSGGFPYFHKYSKVPGQGMKRIFLFGIIIIAFFVSSEVAISKEASIEDLTIELNGEMEVNFSVINCCTEKLEEAIRSGVPTTFTFRIKLYLVRSFWPDKKVASLKFKHRIKYDNITKEYQFHFEENDNNLSVKDFERAKEIMVKVNGAKLLPTNRLKKGRKYYIDVKAELDPSRLPFGLENIFFFLSFWDVETDWLRYEFTY
jgi:hypothetical protein